MTEHLKRTLGPVMLWGLGVGYVISGMYFGWNLGLKEGGPLGLGIATFFITIMYLAFTLSYTELACAIPRAGGAFSYAQAALGDSWGFIAGLSQIIEFVFAPPAIAAAIGAYFSLFSDRLPALGIAMIVYVLFTGLNIYGVKAAASFELLMSAFAVVELLIFAVVTWPHVTWEHLSHNPLPNGMAGIFAAVPFAIWFFLGIEGVANVAEETINPQRNVVAGFGSAILTLVVLCILTFVGAVGVGGWENVVFPSPGAAPSDSPLPLALGQVVEPGHLLFHMLITVGLFGLIASFHGIILAAGRATLEFGREGFAFRALGKIHPKFETPAVALVTNMIFGIGALVTGKTGEIITFSCFGALSLYIISMVSLLRFRKTTPHAIRPFKVPFYPWTPLAALVIGIVALGAMVVNAKFIALIYFLTVGVSFAAFHFVRRKRAIEIPS